MLWLLGSKMLYCVDRVTVQQISEQIGDWEMCRGTDPGGISDLSLCKVTVTVV